MIAAMADPPARLRPFLGLEGPLAIAHRGGGAERPENTMAAFEHAVGLGYRCVETDVQATRDRVVVVYHDADLDRLTRHTGPVAARDWRELSTFRVNGTEPIPRLEEVLGAWPDLRLVVDPKADDVVGPLIGTLRRTDARHRVCIGSFSAHRLRWVRADAPGCTSCSPSEVVRLRAESWSMRLGTLEANCVQVPPRQPIFGDISIPVVDAAFVRAAHARGLPVQVWTVDEEAEMERFLDLGVDAIMSDHVTRLKAVFERRNVWR